MDHGFESNETQPPLPPGDPDDGPVSGRASPGTEGAASLAAGALIAGRFRIVRLLGRGGMGEVYLAGDTRLDRQVALKVLSARLAGDPEHRRRFIQEARAASSLNHPHVCIIHEVGEFEGGLPMSSMAMGAPFLVAVTAE